jgi:predicted acyl esterase
VIPILGAASLLLLGTVCVPQQDPIAKVAARFDVSDVMIPARDGVKLHTRIFVPTDPRGPLPFLMKRTPYGIGGAESSFIGSWKDLAEEGYIFVFQDIRGRYGSEGAFVMQRPARKPGDTGAVDEAPTPGHDRVAPEERREP